MHVGTQELSSLDIERIAQLHVQGIADSLVALLGERFAVRFYRYLADSECECLFVERVGDRVESCCLVSFEPGSLHGRMARGTLPALGVHALLALRRPDFRAYLKGAVRDALHGHGEDSSQPEITYIFTNGALRGRGLGGRLIERVDAHLHERGIGSYNVKTLDDPGNRAISFYLENGFAPIATRVEAGRRYVEFQKKLGSADLSVTTRHRVRRAGRRRLAAGDSGRALSGRGASRRRVGGAGTGGCA